MVCAVENLTRQSYSANDTTADYEFKAVRLDLNIPPRIASSRDTFST